MIATAPHTPPTTPPAITPVLEVDCVFSSVLLLSLSPVAEAVGWVFETFEVVVLWGWVGTSLFKPVL